MPRKMYQIVNGQKFPMAFLPEAIKSALDIKVQPYDVILCTYPKCGTNWCEQIIQILRNKGQPHNDGVEIMLNCPFLELLGADALANQKPPRFYKVHLDYDNIERNDLAKYVVVVRNPKDCFVSFYHFLNTDVQGPKKILFEDMFQSFITGDLAYGNYFDYVQKWYEHRNDPNVLFLYYEKMKMDHRGSVVQIANFLGPEYADLVKDDKVLDDVVYYSSLEYMKKTSGDAFDTVIRKYGFSGVDLDSVDLPSGLKHYLKRLKNLPMTDGGTVGLVRKGTVGDGKVTLNEDMNRIMDQMLKERLGDTEMYKFWIENGCI